NYELLAKPSPHKAPTKPDATKLDDSDDDFAAPASKAAAQPAAAPPKPLTVAPVKKRGRPAGTKNKSNEETEVKEPKATKGKPAAQPLGQSPVAKAYA